MRMWNYFNFIRLILIFIIFFELKYFPLKSSQGVALAGQEKPEDNQPIKKSKSKWDAPAPVEKKKSKGDVPAPIESQAQNKMELENPPLSPKGIQSTQSTQVDNPIAPGAGSSSGIQAQTDSVPLNPNLNSGPTRVRGQ